MSKKKQTEEERRRLHQRCERERYLDRKNSLKNLKDVLPTINDKSSITEGRILRGAIEYIRILQTTLDEDNLDKDTLDFLFKDKQTDYERELNRRREERQRKLALEVHTLAWMLERKII